ncbi:unnamed protein product, partial [Durusdinium trenchii]
EGDVYPTGVRELKTELLNTLLSLLEGRMDNRIHQTVVQRGDPLVIRERIQPRAKLGQRRSCGHRWGRRSQNHPESHRGCDVSICMFAGIRV